MKTGLLVALAVIILDQASKFVLIDLLAAHPLGIRLTSFFNLVQVWNPGVSFGMFARGETGEIQRWVLAGLAVAVSGLLLVWLARAERGLDRLALGLVIGGALGNAIDRVLYGAVADFFDFHLAGWHWPAFNIADAAISCGAVMLVLAAILPSKSPALE